MAFKTTTGLFFCIVQLLFYTVLTSFSFIPYSFSLINQFATFCTILTFPPSDLRGHPGFILVLSELSFFLIQNSLRFNPSGFKVLSQVLVLTEQGKNCVFSQPPLHTDDRTLCYTNQESAPCGTKTRKVKMTTDLNTSCFCSVYCRDLFYRRSALQ